jgi:hypothetical protein
MGLLERERDGSDQGMAEFLEVTRSGRGRHSVVERDGDDPLHARRLDRNDWHPALAKQCDRLLKTGAATDQHHGIHGSRRNAESLVSRLGEQ